MTTHFDRRDPARLREEVSAQLDEVCALLNARTGHDFSRYKRSTLVRRIERRIHLLQETSVASYLERLRRDRGYLFLGPAESAEAQPDLFRPVDKKHRIYQSREPLLRPVVHFPLADVGRTRRPPLDDPARSPHGPVQGVVHAFESEAREPVVGDLEEELRRTRAHLHATVEQLESSNEELRASNEELLSMNEELQSANEELQTSQEELQSVNEELARVNAELARNLDELARAQEEHAWRAAIVDSSQDAIFGKTLDGVITSWNAGAEQVYGYTAREVIGRHVDRLFPPDRAEESMGIMERLRRGERVEPYETVRVRKDGARIDVRVCVSPVCGSAGEIIGASSIARDITSGKLAEQALRESEQRFRVMADTVPSILYTADPAGMCDYANRRFYEYTGLPDGAALGDGWGAVVHPEDAAAALAGWMEAVGEGRPYEADYRLRGADGGYRWFMARSQPVRGEDGRIVRWFGVVTDVDDLKRTQAALERSESRLRRLVDSNIIGVLYSDRSGNVSAANDAFLATIGYSRDELAAGRVPWAELTPPEYQALDAAAMEEAASRGASTPHEKEYVRRDGTRVPILVGSALLPGSEEDFVCFVVDLSERKRIERALAEAAQRKDEFLAMLGHELRNPLAPIRNSLHILNERRASEEQRARALSVLDRQVSHMTRLVDDLLDMSRVTQGKILLRRERVDFAALVRTEIDDHRPAFAAAGLALAVAVEEEPLWVDGDATRLAQVVGNLLRNAGKFTDAGGRVAVELAREAEGWVRLTVSDTGIGIAPDLLPRLFEPFSQADHSLDRSRGGLGLGLALVKSLVELHGGSVEASSEGSGRGSRFLLRLPPATPARSDLRP